MTPAAYLIKSAVHVKRAAPGPLGPNPKAKALMDMLAAKPKPAIPLAKPNPPVAERYLTGRPVPRTNMPIGPTQGMRNLNSNADPRLGAAGAESRLEMPQVAGKGDPGQRNNIPGAVAAGLGLGAAGTGLGYLWANS